MKVRMHEKAKKKTSEKYSVQQLLEKVTGNRNNNINCNQKLFLIDLICVF